MCFVLFVRIVLLVSFNSLETAVSGEPCTCVYMQYLYIYLSSICPFFLLSVCPHVQTSCMHAHTVRFISTKFGMRLEQERERDSLTVS